MLPIALQVYSVRDDAEKDLAGVLRGIKTMGYDGVEFAGLYGNAPARIKAVLAETGLVPVSAHVPYADMMADPDGVLGAYAEIGCRYAAVPYLTEEYRIGGPKGGEAVAGMRMLGEKCRALGMTLLYHNHDFEFEKLNGEYKLDLLYKAVPAGLLQTEVDTCWVKAAGEDPAAYVRKYAGRAPVVHLKDFYMEGAGPKGAYELIGTESGGKKLGRSIFKKPGRIFEFRPLGAGLQDIPSLVAAARDAGAGWVVVEQDLPCQGKTAAQCAQESLDYLRSL